MIEPFDPGRLFGLAPLRELPPPGVSPSYDASSLKFLEGIHRRKSEGLKQIIAEGGWPDAKRFGEHAEAAAFMIVQHADYDPDFQKLCHALMLATLSSPRLRGEQEGGDGFSMQSKTHPHLTSPASGGGKNVRLGYLAFLTDRILCNSGKHQRFGTQIREVTNGCFVPKPMEDPERVDTLRETVGLGESLSDYYVRVNNGDLLLYRPLLNGYAEELEERKAHKVIEFPGKNPH